MWHYIPDPTPPSYGNFNNPTSSEDPIKAAKSAIRFYKSLIAEHKREHEKKDKVKVERWYSKISKAQLATFLFFTWWMIPLSQIWAIKMVQQAWEAFTK